MSWSLAEAKNRFGEVENLALTSGPSFEGLDLERAQSPMRDVER